MLVLCPILSASPAMTVMTLLTTTETDKRQLTSCRCPESVLWQLGFESVCVVVVYIGAWIVLHRTNWHDRGNVQPEWSGGGEANKEFSSPPVNGWNLCVEILSGVACRAERIIISFNFYGYFIICCRVVLLSSSSSAVCTVLLSVLFGRLKD